MTLAGKTSRADRPNRYCSEFISPLAVPPKGLFVGPQRPRYSWKMGCARPWAPALGALGLVALLAGCGMSRQAGAAVDAGRRSTGQGGFVHALQHYRTATRPAPDSA